jgi:hypothetical protein
LLFPFSFCLNFLPLRHEDTKGFTVKTLRPGVFVASSNSF